MTVIVNVVSLAFFSIVDENTSISLVETLLHLLAVADGKIFPSLVCVSPRDNALRQSIQHILCGSGLFPTIYKIEKIYGEDAKQEFALFLYQNYEAMFWMSNGMKRELDIWLQKHEDLKNTKLSDNY